MITYLYISLISITILLSYNILFINLFRYKSYEYCYVTRPVLRSIDSLSISFLTLLSIILSLCLLNGLYILLT